MDEQALIAALEAALEHHDNDDDDHGAMTTQELAKALDKHETAIRKRLRMLLEEGRLEVLRVRRVDLCGRMTRVPGYRLRRGD